MSIPDGSPPSIICYSKAVSKNTKLSDYSDLVDIISILYSDNACTNPIGKYLWQSEFFNKEPDPVKGRICNYYGTFIFDDYGSINFQDSKYETTKETSYINPIVFGSGNFLNCSGFKVSSNNADLNLQHLIYIAK
jgi:hypothetical protein